MTYAKIHQKSADSVSNALDCFEAPPTTTSVMEGNTIEIGPLGDPNASDLDFAYESSGQNYIDGKNSYLHVQCKVVKADGTAIEQGDTLKVMPVTNFLHNLFAMVVMSYGNFTVEYLDNYPYVAYLENLLDSGSASKKSIDQAHMWIEDAIGVIDTEDIAASHAAAVTKRKALIQQSKTIDLCGRLNLGVLSQKNYLPPGAPIKLRLTRSTPAFCLTRTETDTQTYKIIISKCSLVLRQVTIHPSIVTAHNALLASGEDMLFPINKVSSQMFAIAAGQQQARLNVVINQQQPKRMIFAVINHASKNGSYDHDPFNFANYDLSSIGLEIDGTPVPAKPITCDFGNNLYTHAFYNLCKVTGKVHSDTEHGITLSKFGNGYAIYAFDLTPDLCEGSGVHLIENKSVTLDINFKTALPHTVSVFAYAERDDLLEISGDKSVQRLSRL